MNTQDSTGNKIYINNESTLYKVFLELFKNIKVLLISTICFGIFSVLFALSLTNQFTSRAILITSEEAQNDIAGLSSQFSSIAAVAGINVNQQNPNELIFLQTIQSIDFFQHVVNKYNDKILVPLLAANKYSPKTEVLSISKKAYDETSGSWLEEVPHIQKIHKDFLDSNFSISQNQKTGIITASMTHISPFFAKEFLELFIQECNDLIRSRDLIDSKKSLDYLENELIASENTAIKQSIASLIEKQLQKGMVIDIRDEYVVKYIEPPYAPYKKSRPFRALICVFITSLGFIITASFIIIRMAFKK